MMRLPSCLSLFLLLYASSFSRPRLYLCKSSTLFCRLLSPSINYPKCSLFSGIFTLLISPIFCKLFRETSLCSYLLIARARQRPFSLLTFVVRFGVFFSCASCGIWYDCTVLKLGTSPKSAVIFDQGELILSNIFLRLYVGDRGAAMIGSDIGFCFHST